MGRDAATGTGLIELPGAIRVLFSIVGRDQTKADRHPPWRQAVRCGPGLDLSISTDRFASFARWSLSGQLRPMMVASGNDRSSAKAAGHVGAFERPVSVSLPSLERCAA